ncbi:MAG: hypothetical protein LC640_01300 [Frankia sp.]|nr:hypothetical protein [Frankia sp.]
MHRWVSAIALAIALALTSHASAGTCVDTPRAATMDAAIRGRSPYSTPGDVVFIGRVLRARALRTQSGLMYSPLLEVQVEATLRGRVPRLVHTRNRNGCFANGQCVYSSAVAPTLLPGQRIVLLTRLNGTSVFPPSGCGGFVWGITVPAAKRLAARYGVSYTEVPDSAIDYVVPRAPRATPAPSTVAAPAASPASSSRALVVPFLAGLLLVCVASALLSVAAGTRRTG